MQPDTRNMSPLIAAEIHQNVAAYPVKGQARSELLAIALPDQTHDDLDRLAIAPLEPSWRNRTGVEQLLPSRRAICVR